jgi:hypothetical protein
VGLTPSDIVRRSDADVPQVTVGGHKNLWTIHYSAWIQAQWRAWADSLGYTAKGLTPWHVAIRDGHPDSEFDAWLESAGAR